MKTKLILACAFFAFVWHFHLTGNIFANEGQFFLQSSLDNDSQCLAYSVEVETNKYNILITCRGLIYPPLPPDSDSYILWADGADTRNSVKLTNLRFGKGAAQKTDKFNRLFVTLERGNPRQPTGPTIMSASLRSYDFDRIPQIEQPSSPDESAADPNVRATPSPTQTRQPFWQTGLGRIIIIITAGFLIFIFILMVYGKRK